MFRSLAILELALFAGLAPHLAGHAPRQDGNTPAGFIGPYSVNSQIEMLHSAVREGRLETIDHLLAQGVSADARDALGSTPLFEAVVSGNVAVIKLLLRYRADVNASQPQNKTALAIAIRAGRSDLVKLLVAAGVDVTARQAGGRTELHLAAAQKGGEEITVILLVAHAPVDAVDDAGNTPLDAAVLHGRRAATAVLLANHANPRRVHAADGRGPLHEACVQGFAGLVTMLVQAGADPTATDRWGQTPLDLALAYKNAAAVTALFQLAEGNARLAEIFGEAMESATVRDRVVTARLLIDSGWSVNHQTRRHSTYLNDAALKGNAKMVRLLLERGARVDAHNEAGGTPLHDAALSGNVEVIELLLDHGSAVDERDLKTGATPLMLAASLGRTEAAALLLRRGADVRLKDNTGRTALDRARGGDDARLIDLLRMAVSSSGRAGHTA